jgi:uncharacterized protein YndB with AHSA1/START domain
MTERSVTHATMVIERTYDVSPAQVFAAWSDPAAKARWFSGPDAWESGAYHLDFTVGGEERLSGGLPGGPVHHYAARYYEIVPDQRIVYAYEMHTDEVRISVSLATVELTPAGSGTRLVVTEQGAFLDGHDTPAQREGGAGSLLDALGAELARHSDAGRKEST